MQERRWGESFDLPFIPDWDKLFLSPEKAFFVGAYRPLGKHLKSILGRND